MRELAVEGRESLEDEEVILVFANGFERVESEVGEEEKVWVVSFFQGDSYILKVIEDFVHEFEACIER
jgi:hypothetical protein